MPYQLHMAISQPKFETGFNVLSSQPNLERYHHYKQVTMMLSPSHQCFAACTQQSDKWNRTVLTCSVTFCAVSKSCSPSGSTSGSTMGTSPFWRHKINNQKLTTTNVSNTHKLICQISYISLYVILIFTVCHLKVFALKICIFFFNCQIKISYSYYIFKTNFSNSHKLNHQISSISLFVIVLSCQLQI